MPSVERDNKGSGFLVRQVSNIPPGLGRHFTKRHFVYVGVKGCACGFFWEDDYPQAEATRENDVEAFECTRELIEYIAEVFKACDLVEAFGCWDRELASPVIQERVFSLSEIMRSGVFSMPVQTRVRFVQ